MTKNQVRKWCRENVGREPVIDRKWGGRWRIRCALVRAVRSRVITADGRGWDRAVVRVEATGRTLESAQRDFVAACERSGVAIRRRRVSPPPPQRRAA